MKAIHQKALAVCLIPIYAEALRRCIEIYRQRPVYDPWRKARPKAAITLVQTPVNAQYTTSTSPRTFVYGSNVTAGSLLVLNLAGFTWASNNIPTVVDSLGNKWRCGSNWGTTGTGTPGLSSQIQIWYALKATAGACTVTVTPQISTYITGCLLEYSGADQIVGPQTTMQQNSTGSTSADCGTIPINWANSLVICAYAQGTTGATATAGSGYTLRSNQPGPSDEGLYVQDQVGVSSAQATALTLSTSTAWYGAAISFRPTQTITSTTTIVQAKGAQKRAMDSTSLTMTFDTSTTAANMLVGFVSGIPATTANYTVSDNVNGTWFQSITYTPGTNSTQAEIWCFPNSGSGTITVTLATSANSILNIGVVEINGLSALPTGTAFSSGASLSPTCGPLTIINNAIVMAVISTEETDVFEVNGATAGWTNVYSHGASTNALTWSRCCGINAQILGNVTPNTAGSYTASWATYDGVHDGYTAVMASFRPPNTPTQKSTNAVSMMLTGRFLDFIGPG